MDTILVVCYSYTGVTRRLAQLLCSHHGWPLGEVLDERPRAGASGTWRCVVDSLLRRHPEVRYFGPDPDDFHTVVLMSPIWAWRLAGPMRTFVTTRRAVLRHVAVISTMGSGGASNAIAEIAHVLGRPPILADAFTTREIEDGSGTARLIAFGDRLRPGAPPVGAAKAFDVDHGRASHAT
jgi:hypothetical protein